MESHLGGFYLCDEQDKASDRYIGQITVDDPNSFFKLYKEGYYFSEIKSLCEANCDKKFQHKVYSMIKEYVESELKSIEKSLQATK